jgi:pimeloyl-ACP methyl ester carboxylesterase
MADDYGGVISEVFDGRIDLVVGESYGGMVAQYLAARHSGTCTFQRDPQFPCRSPPSKAERVEEVQRRE